MKIVPWIKRAIAKRINVRTFERAVFIPLYHTAFSGLPESRKFKNRVDLWTAFFADADLTDKKILYLEFGVWKGDSIEVMLSLNKNEASRFIGFDTFEGLPEDWVTSIPKGHFDLGGRAPVLADSRCEFVKGLFQDTLNGKLDELDFTEFDEVVVHYDQDLYSATSYVLHELRHRVKGYHFIFDEFQIDEGRALYNFLQTYPQESSYFGYVSDGVGYCIQVAGKLD